MRGTVGKKIFAAAISPFGIDTFIKATQIKPIDREPGEKVPELSQHVFNRLIYLPIIRVTTQAQADKVVKYVIKMVNDLIRHHGFVYEDTPSDVYRLSGCAIKPEKKRSDTTLIAKAKL
jgi:hypothetical protein